jgi:hypothetical protein
MEILVSPEDAHLLELRWKITPVGYVRRNWVETGGVRRHEFLHRLVAKAEPGVMVDHINGNLLDNRRENLRACTAGENSRNKKMHKNNKTGFKGVYPHREKFCAQIRANGVKYRLGAFDSPEEAHAEYVRAAKKLHGEFARTA